MNVSTQNRVEQYPAQSAVLSTMPALKEFAVQEGKTGHTEEKVINDGTSDKCPVNTSDQKHHGASKKGNNGSGLGQLKKTPSLSYMKAKALRHEHASVLLPWKINWVGMKSPDILF